MRWVSTERYEEFGNSCIKSTTAEGFDVITIHRLSGWMFYRVPWLRGVRPTALSSYYEMQHGSISTGKGLFGQCMGSMQTQISGEFEQLLICNGNSGL